MGLRLLVLVALAAYKCDALPSATDLVVPEGMMMQFAFSSMTPTAFISAMTKNGGTEAQCSTFASTTVDTIKTAVSSQQGILNALANGDECAALGQPLVTSTKDAVVAAQVVVVTKQGEAATALSKKDTTCSVGVDFSVGLEALEANSCYDYTSQTGYTQAKATCDSATTSLKTADANVATAQTVVTDYQATAADAVAEAARLESGCLCNAHKRQTAAWASATTDHASHAADWKQAHEILCALDSASTTCNFDACPTVAKPRVAAGVETADQNHCTEAPTATPTATPTGTPTANMCGCSGESNGIKCSMTDAERSCDQDAVCDGEDEVEFGDWAKLCTPKANLDMCMCTGSLNEYECTQTGKGHCGNTQRCVKQQDNKDVEVKYGDWSKICFEETVADKEEKLRDCNAISAGSRSDHRQVNKVLFWHFGTVQPVFKYKVAGGEWIDFSSPSVESFPNWWRSAPWDYDFRTMVDSRHYDFAVFVNDIKVKTYSEQATVKRWTNGNEGRFGIPKNAEEADKLCAN